MKHEIFILFDQPFFLSTVFSMGIPEELHSTQVSFKVLNFCNIEKLIKIR